MSKIIEGISNIENAYSKFTEVKKDSVNQFCFDILRSIHAKLKDLPNLTKTENEVLRKTQELGTYLYIKHCPTAQKRIVDNHSADFLNQLNEKLETALCHIADLKRNQKSFLGKYRGIIKSCNLKTQRMI